MPTMKPNIINRVAKLTKPTSSLQALIPIFEAVSNAAFAIEDKRDLQENFEGLVEIKIDTLSDHDKIHIEISDNGIGLDEERYAAFLELDTPFRTSKGGKGVGRLFWLDAFEEICVESTYKTGSTVCSRSFRFRLHNEHAIDDLRIHEVSGIATGTKITFKGLKDKSYREKFPKRAGTIFIDFASHFISDFLFAKEIKVKFDIDLEQKNYPDEVTQLIVEPHLKKMSFVDENFGTIEIDGFALKEEASNGLKGSHQLHLLGNGRTVETRSIDKLIAIKSMIANDEKPILLHACVESRFLDERVNESRTSFAIDEKILNSFVKRCVEEIKKVYLSEQIDHRKKEIAKRLQKFIEQNPIYGFEPAEILLDRLKITSETNEEFASDLVKHKVRQDEGREAAVGEILSKLDLDGSFEDGLADVIAKTASEIQENERLSLAHLVVRRKFVLEILQKMIDKVARTNDDSLDYHLERTLHSFLVPMNVRGGDASKIDIKSHDLWLIDERLAFTSSFSSDARFKDLSKESVSNDRADLLVWDFAVGMGVFDPERGESQVDCTRPLDKVMIVEFKRPGRGNYKAGESVEHQIKKYIRELRNKKIVNYEGSTVQIASDCRFYCFVIADIEGDLKEDLDDWQDTANGLGKIHHFHGEYKGSIEVIQWQQLVNDAWMRNAASLSALGFSKAERIIS